MQIMIKDFLNRFLDSNVKKSTKNNLKVKIFPYAIVIQVLKAVQET